MVKLDNTNTYKWTSLSDVSVKGYAYDDKNVILTEKRLAGYFKNVKGDKDFSERLNKLNGSFAVVADFLGKIFVAVDHVRSFPMYFKLKKREIFISDQIDVNCVNNNLDFHSVLEFISAGYSIGNTTLLDNHKQLLAGQYLSYNRKTNVVSLSFYYNHNHTYTNSNNVSNHLKKLDKISDNVIKRLIGIAKDKMIVLPLSGGYDSRYIAGLLKQNNFTRVLCYTYGSLNSFEVETSKKVAKELGFQWVFIEYNKEKWIETLRSDLFKEYCIYASNVSSLPHIQDFIAIKELKATGVLSNDSVFIPGFCGDLLGGSLLPNYFYFNEERKILELNIKDFIYDNFFQNLDTKINSQREHVIQRISTSLPKDEIITTDDFVSYYEEWFTKHKVGKFVNNGLRIYEFFGYHWLIPLWDKELIEYWYKVPNELRIQSKLYEHHLFENIFKPLNINFIKKDKMNPSKLRGGVKKIIPSVFFSMAQKIFWSLMGKGELININSYDELSYFIVSEFKNKGIPLNGKFHPYRLLALYFLEFQLGIDTSKYI